MIIYVKPGRNKRPVYIIADGEEPELKESEAEKNVKQSIDALAIVLKRLIIFAGVLAVIGFIAVAVTL